MFVARYELGVRESPSGLLGMYGYREVFPSGGVVTVSVSNRPLAFLVARSGVIPEGRKLKKIDDLDTAKNFTSVENRSFEVSRNNSFDPVAVLDDKLEDGETVESGTISMNEETRTPTGRFYIAARGVLVSEMQYSEDAGWQETQPTPDSTYSVRGFHIPLFSAMATLSKQ